MRVDVTFQSSSTPKTHDAVAVYEKGSLLCIELTDGLICKYPMPNIFSVVHRHVDHLGSSKVAEGSDETV